MKTILILTLSFFSIFTFSQAQGGGSDTGGAGFQRATSEQVRTIFENKEQFDIKAAVLLVADSIRQRLASSLVTDDKLKSILEVTVNSKKWGHATSFRDDVLNSQYYLKPSGLCEYGSGLLNEGSTRIHQTETPICFSLEALTQLPIQAVPGQMIAIAFHEHAHHFALGNSINDEALGGDIQSYVLNLLLENQAFDDFLSLSFNAAFVGDQGWLHQEFSRSYARGCVKVGRINERFKSVRQYISAEELNVQKRLLLTLTNRYSRLPSIESVDKVLELSSLAVKSCETKPSYSEESRQIINELEQSLRAYFASTQN